MCNAYPFLTIKLHCYDSISLFRVKVKVYRFDYNYAIINLSTEFVEGDQ